MLPGIPPAEGRAGPAPHSPRHGSHGPAFTPQRHAPLWGADRRCLSARDCQKEAPHPLTPSPAHPLTFPCTWPKNPVEITSRIWILKRIRFRRGDPKWSRASSRRVLVAGFARIPPDCVARCGTLASSATGQPAAADLPLSAFVVGSISSRTSPRQRAGVR